MGVSLANLNRWPVLFALCLGGFLSVSSATALERRTALVLGNGDYRIAPLDNPVNDARDMAATLERLGFEVDLRLNLDRKGMRAAIREFGEKLSQGGVGLFYYAGHGVQIAGRNYLVPLGTEIHAADEVIDEAVDAGLVMRKMESAGNPVNIVILDACRDNPFVRSYRSLERGLAKMEGPLGSLIAYATAPGDTALDGEGRNGVYTKHLLEAMTRPGLPLEQVFKRVRNGVRRQTDGRQIPWEESSLTGDFYFIPPDGKTSS
ncbi:MAG: caspase family protein, partial [Methylothermaceae bacterium]|nr:caspase family protein [Methylothermaceae bacterium]